MTEEITETASNIGFFDLLRSRIRTVPFTMYRCLNHVLLDHRETWDFAGCKVSGTPAPPKDVSPRCLRFPIVSESLITLHTAKPGKSWAGGSAVLVTLGATFLLWTASSS
jgi:hypothetical protein